jgi:hypothetical protein
VELKEEEADLEKARGEIDEAWEELGDVRIEAEEARTELRDTKQQLATERAIQLEDESDDLKKDESDDLKKARDDLVAALEEVKELKSEVLELRPELQDLKQERNSERPIQPNTVRPNATQFNVGQVNTPQPDIRPTPSTSSRLPKRKTPRLKTPVREPLRPNSAANIPPRPKRVRINTPEIMSEDEWDEGDIIEVVLYANSASKKGGKRTKLRVPARVDYFDPENTIEAGILHLDFLTLDRHVVNAARANSNESKQYFPPTLLLTIVVVSIVPEVRGQGVVFLLWDGVGRVILVYSTGNDATFLSWWAMTWESWGYSWLRR